MRNTSLEYTSQTYNNFTAVYTDGSKTQLGARFSFYVPSLAVRRSYTCPIVFSIYSIEMLAIRHALSWISETLIPSCEVVILSDCLSAIQAINNPEKGHNDVNTREILTLLDLIENGERKVIITWIAGHVGIREMSKQISSHVPLHPEKQLSQRLYCQKVTF